MYWKWNLKEKNKMRILKFIMVFGFVLSIFIVIEVVKFIFKVINFNEKVKVRLIFS